MDEEKIERWKQQYNTVDLNSLEWVVMDTYALLNFYDTNYVDEELDEAVSEDIMHYHALGMHYVPMRKESPDIRYLIGMCNNSIGKKTMIACISYVENYRLFVGQYTPLTHLCTCEVNKFFRNRGISKMMFDEFAKVIRPNQHFISTPQSDDGAFCHVHRNLYNSLINSGFEMSITLPNRDEEHLTPEYRELLCSEPMQLKLK